MSKLKGRELDRIFAHYIATALWSTTRGDSGNLDDLYSIEDLDHTTAVEMKAEMLAFIKENRHLLTSKDNQKNEYFVHNFWLTRNGHGAGFWDRDYENGDALTEACVKYGELHLEVGDNGLIYKMG